MCSKLARRVENRGNIGKYFCDWVLRGGSGGRIGLRGKVGGDDGGRSMEGRVAAALICVWGKVAEVGSDEDGTA